MKRTLPSATRSPRACASITLLLTFSGTSLPGLAAQGALNLQEAQQAYRSARSALQCGFASPRQRYISCIDEGSLLIAREPDFTPRILVKRGPEGTITRAVPSTDGHSLFYVRESSGPAATHELLQLDIESDEAPTLVASGAEIPSQFIFAPNGEAFAFAEGTMIYEFRRNEAGRWQRRPLLDAHDPRHKAAISLDGITYSPDGLRIAFVSMRKAKQSYIAVHDISKAETRYIEPSVFRDLSPVWSPDGAELAFARVPINLTMRYRFTPQLEGVPWSILAADAKSGAIRTVWTADPGPGSVATNSPLIWTPGGDILFTWEKTGWELLYAVSARGGRARLLTPGEGEVDDVVLSADGRTVVYEANIGDVARTHVWSVAPSVGKPIQLTSGEGVESRPRLSAGGYLSYVADNRAQSPPQVVIRSPKGEVRPLRIHSADIIKRNQRVWGRFQPTETITARAVDGVTSHHVVVKPQTPPPVGGYPVIVNARGGPAAQTLPGISPNYLFAQYAADRGYLHVDINYRGSTGFGLSYRLPEGRGATGGSEVKDLAAVAAYLRSREDVNPKRIGIMGSSYGGHLVGLAMSRLPDDYAAGVSLFGVADWVVEMKKDQQDERGSGVSAPPQYIRLSERTRIEDLAYASSPSAHIENWRGPVLFTIGDLDKQGHVESVTDLAYQLLARGVPVEFYVDPAGGHNVYPIQRVCEFFDRTLRTPGPRAAGTAEGASDDAAR